MPQQQQHTIVRFSLRSLLAITFGLAIVMTVAGPFIRELDSEEQQRLYFALVLLGLGVIASVAFCVYQRYKLGSMCGRLLITISNRSEQSVKRRPWLFLYYHVPAYTFFAYMLAGAERESYLDYVYVFLLPAVYGGALAEHGLLSWAEGYTDEMQFCENGILMGTKFYKWSAKKLKSLRWDTFDDKLTIQYRIATMEIKVPLHQREAVDAILEHYYKPQRHPVTDEPERTS